MAGKWDTNLKRLVGVNPQDFVSWLLPGAQYIRELSGHFSRGVDADILYEIELEEEQLLLHIEFQRYEDEEMDKRVWEYNVLATCKFGCPVASFVIYLKKEGKVAKSPYRVKLKRRWEIHRFNFINIQLWEIATEMLRNLKLVGLLPLLPLTREGGSKEVVEEVISGIQGSTLPKEIQIDLLSITLTLAPLGLPTQEARDWLIRRFRMMHDILHESDIYQLILQEGQEKGREEALQRELEDLRQILLSFVRARFPKLVRFATKQISTITDKKTLADLIPKVGLAQTEAEVRQILTEVGKNA